MRTAIAISKLAKYYGRHKIVDGISLKLNQGEALGLLGANGAGKSTLIKSILGLVLANGGDIEFSGNPPAYLPENPQLPLSLSALNLLQFKCASFGLKAKDAEIMLGQLGLPASRHQTALREYSKGMRQRTALAFALCGDPECILLDEPMSGLDALGRAEILSLLKQRRDGGAAFLMSSHIVTDMVQLCDRVLIMAKGKICEEVTISEHSMHEVKVLEDKLAYWTGDHPRE